MKDFIENKFLTIILIIFAIILFTNCTASEDVSHNTRHNKPVLIQDVILSKASVPGDSLMPASQQKNVANAINIFESFAHSDCQSPHITNTIVTKKPASKLESWEENWVIDRCGQSVQYNIYFTPDSKGNIGFSISIANQK